ncbi:enoyl-CoA hydratase [Azospira restricta]|uniref:Enoyl-CoA hydratase domain-containing protein 3, mitochondrial n=1 Tax=Azospira restricta TaxID=404405 RepID=A0A974PWN6_9RHOO|nr:enoyl-CoA hydratase [Azospira restricta]QRJ62508.1 enoyl-CoA hydratase [Azospira restricta]
MEQQEQVLLREDRADGVTVLTLNRPAQFNSLSLEVLGALQAALDDIAGDAAVRVVVVAGAGKAFCAGHDLREMRAHPEKAFMQQLFKAMAKVCTTLQRLPQPVIARVHGVATAAGCQLVAACDLAVAADVARFGTSGINVGLFCTSPGVALSRNVGRKAALEMLLTGGLIDAPTALREGLVNRVVPEDRLNEEVAALAAAIVAKSPLAVAMGKRAFYEQLEMGVEAAYQLAGETMACNMMAADAAEGIDAFTEKRPPVWRGD